MLRITRTTPEPQQILPLSEADVTDVAHVTAQVWKSSAVDRVADHLAIRVNIREERDCLARRLRALGFVVRIVDRWYLTVIGRDAAHPAVRALSAPELDARIAYLTGLREAATANTTTNEP